MSPLHAIRLAARSTLGLDIERHTPMTDPFLRLAEILRQQEIAVVLDVGANDGGFASDLFAAGYRGQIVSFEPLPDARKRLRARAKAHHDRWTIAPPVALSDRSGHTTFNIAGNSVSSSLLQMTDAHTSAAPASGTVGQFEVETIRLDEIWPNIAPPDARRVLLKIDTQGAERMVLEGAGELLGSAVVAIQLEMSLARLYEGQALAHEIDEYLRSLDFTLWDVIPGFRDPNTFRLLQLDGFYFRAHITSCPA